MFLFEKNKIIEELLEKCRLSKRRDYYGNYYRMYYKKGK